MNFNEYRTAYNAKAENSVEFSAFFEPRSGEGRISGRNEGVSDANDVSRRRNVSGAAFSLTGRCRVSDRGLKSIATKKEKVSDFLFFSRPNGPGIEPLDYSFHLCGTNTGGCVGTKPSGIGEP